MTEEIKPEKTGITELAIIASVLSFAEPAVSYVMNTPLIPDPFDKLAVGVLAVTIWGLRRRQKKLAK